MRGITNVYEGFTDLEDVIREFQITSADVKGYKVVVAIYNHEGYEGDAYLLLKKGAAYYEVHGSHCSCYGLEDQFSLEATTKDAIKHIQTKGRSYGARLMAVPVINEHFGWKE